MKRRGVMTGRIPLIRPFDFILTAMVFLAVLTGIVFRMSLPSSGMIDILQDGRRVMELRSDREGLWKIGGLTLETGPAGIRVRDSDCPNQLCVRQGWIRSPGRSVICVPNRIVAIIRQEKGGGGIDGISR